MRPPAKELTTTVRGFCLFCGWWLPVTVASGLAGLNVVYPVKPRRFTALSTAVCVRAIARLIVDLRYWSQYQLAKSQFRRVRKS